VAGGDPPDIAMAWELQYPILADKGVYKDLSQIIQGDAEYQNNVLPDFYESHIQMYTWKGKLYVLPEQNASVVLYYNKKLFDEAGLSHPPSDWSDTSWTWEVFLDACRKLTKKDGDTFTQYGYTEAWWPPLSAVIFAYSNDGNWFDRYNDPTKVTMTDPKVVEAFQFYSDLWNKEQVATNPEQWKVQAGYQMFAAGKAAMTLVGHWFYPEFSKPEHNLSMDIGVFPIGSGGTTSKTDLGGTGMSMVNMTKHSDEAWKFLKFECGPEGQKIIAESGLFAPTLKSVANSDAFLASHKAIQNAAVFNTAMDNAVSFPIGPAWDAMADRLGRNLDALWNGQSSAADALAAAEKEMQQALDESRAE
jgi:multiple sugar transport system substrate-binding protein